MPAVDVILDVRKEFNVLPRRVIIAALHRLGVSGRLLKYICALLSERAMRVKIGNALSESRRTLRDLPLASLKRSTHIARSVARDAIKLEETRYEIAFQGPQAAAASKIMKSLAHPDAKLIVKRTIALQHPGPKVVEEHFASLSLA